MFLIGGCNSSKVNSPASTSNIPQKIPFVIFLQNAEEKNITDDAKAVIPVSSDTGFIYRFDTSSGKISADDTSLFRRIIQGSYNFRMVWDGEKKILVYIIPFGGSFKLESLNSNYDIKELKPVESKFGAVIKNDIDAAEVYNENNKIIVEFESGEKQILNPSLPPEALQPTPLLLSGDKRKYRVLITYNIPSSEEKGAMAGKLLLAVVKDGSIHWKEVKGEYCSFIAGAGSSIAQIGEEIFINACGKVMVLNLQKDPLTLEQYKPVNDLVLTVKDNFQEEPGPIIPRFGVYRNCLMVLVENSKEKWLWFLRNGFYLGGVHINTSNSQIEANLSGKESEVKYLPLKPSLESLQLPVDRYGTW